MAETGKPDVCLLACWGFSLLAGAIAFLWVITALPLVAALMVCGGLGVLIAIAVSRMVCATGAVSAPARAPEASATVSRDRVTTAPAAPPAPDPAGAQDMKAQRPARLPAPRGGRPDALQRIKGIGPALERACHGLGIYHFDQIAALSAPQVAWIEGHVKGARGRVSRDDWVGQARAVAEDAKTPDENRVMDKGDGADGDAATRQNDRGT